MEQNSKSNDLNNNKPLNKHITAPIELNLLSKLLEVQGIWQPYFDEVYPKLDALDNVTVAHIYTTKKPNISTRIIEKLKKDESFKNRPVNANPVA